MDTWPPCLKLNFPRPPSGYLQLHAPATPRALSVCGTLFYWNSMCDQSEGLFRGLSLNHEYMALSKIGPPQTPLQDTCGSTHPVRVLRSLRSHLLYWNTTRDQSEGLFRGLTSNPKYTALSKVGPPQSECIAHFAQGLNK